MLSNAVRKAVGRGDRFEESLVGFATSFGSAGAMATLAMLLQKPFIFPSLGATVFLLFHKSTAAAASPRNTLLGHLAGVLCGLFALQVCGLADSAGAFVEGMSWSRVWACALSLGLTTALMTGLRIPHPPAGATTLIVALGLMRTVEDVSVLLLSIGIVVAVASMVHRAMGSPYPLWEKVSGET